MTERGVEVAIADYGLLSDCHSVALVSTAGSIDWYCTPHIDSPAVFARLLDVEQGGFCAIAPEGEVRSVERRYLDRTMVIETVHHTNDGTLRVRDCLAMRNGGRTNPRRQLIRIATCDEGDVAVRCRVAARFDFGMIPPLVRDHGDGSFTLVGGSGGLAVWSDAELAIEGRHDLVGVNRLAADEQMVLSFTTYPPEELDLGDPEPPRADMVVRHLEESIDWWQNWCDAREGGRRPRADPALRSALVLKSLVHAPTGAIAAAATTSLPEVPGGSWNWDYRFSWIRDSWMTVRSLAEVGFPEESEGFRRFIQRSSAGSARELRLLYGVDGRHRTPEIELDDLAGYRGARPVRIGNSASEQLQLDMYGYLLELVWRRIERGAQLDESYRRFIVEVVDAVCRCWQEPDHGIWELRGPPQHWTYSKVLCWAAIDRGIRIAEALDCEGEVDAERWHATREQIRSTVESNGVRRSDGAFVATLEGDEMDASLLLIPEFGFVAPDDDRVAATVDAVRDTLGDRGLIRRFRHADHSATEGCFIACTFWLVERLIDLDRIDEARATFERAVGTANDLGLFAEEYHIHAGEPLGNFPQALSHLAHIGAIAAFRRAGIEPPD